MRKLALFLFVALVCMSCNDGYFNDGIGHNNQSENEISTRAGKTEVTTFSKLTSVEKNDLANAVRMDDNLYYKGYAVLSDGYAGIVYYKTETTVILLQSIFNSFSDTRSLRFNDANAQALFQFMGFRYTNLPTNPPAAPTELRSTFSGITFILPLSVSQQIMDTYNCTFSVIQNAMGQVAAAQGGNGIRVSLGANQQNYTSELKIQVMGDKRVFTKNTGSPRTFSIIAAGLH